MIFSNENGALVAQRGGETLKIEAWGKNALRVRATMLSDFIGEDWALTEKVSDNGGSEVTVKIYKKDYLEGEGYISHQPHAEIRNGRIRAEINFAGVLSDLWSRQCKTNHALSPEL